MKKIIVSLVLLIALASCKMIPSQYFVVRDYGSTFELTVWTEEGVKHTDEHFWVTIETEYDFSYLLIPSDDSDITIWLQGVELEPVYNEVVRVNL